MNKVFESDTTVVHDDRTALTVEQALEKLFNGQSIEINCPPDFSAENDWEVFDSGYRIYLTDIIDNKLLREQPKEVSEKQVIEYLRGYEIYL